MAQKVTVVLVDDVDGGKADETVTFAVDGVTYEIDLSSANAADLRAAFAKWTPRARRVSARGPARGRRASGANNDVARIREWARGQGLDVSERGRISAKLRAAYHAAH